MSTPPKFSHPALLVEKLFNRFTAIYGSQKYTSMWSGLVPHDSHRTEEQTRQAWDEAMHEVRSIWAEALGNFHMDVISAAVRDLAVSDQLWPPSLPEFCGRCREQEERLKPGALVAITNAPTPADPESPVVKAALEEMRKFTERRKVS